MSKFYRRPYVGLALGGGGARGLAHIGILKVFQGMDIPIDCLAGSSMGGLIAALFAVGLPIDRIEQEAIRLSKVSQIFKLVDLNPPRRGLMRSDRIRSYFTELIGGDKRIENLNIPLSLTSVDLKTHKEITLTKGSLIDAMMATCSVPGLFPPTEINDQLLVDGGLLNNVPADHVRKIGAEIIIAVDVNYMIDTDIQWANITQVPPLSKVIPTFAMDLYQAEIIMTGALTEYNLLKAHPDFILRPKIPSEVNIFFGFSYAENTIAAGELIAQQYIPEIQNRIKPGWRFPVPFPVIDRKT